jgi:integrase
VQTLLSGLLRAGYAPATAGHVRTMLRAALNALVRQGDLSRNVASLVDVPAREHEARPLTPDEATAFLRALRGEPLEALFTVALAAGLRVGEATGLRWQDVNLDSGAVWLRVQIQRQDRKDVLKSLKSDRSRQFVLPAFAIAALVRHHEKHAATPRNPWGLIFTTAKGAPVSTQYLSWRLRRILDDAKIPRRTMHDLRHSAISILIAEGATPVEVAALAGHSSPAITMRVYAHAFATSKQRMADLMDKAMRQKEDKGFS